MALSVFPSPIAIPGRAWPVKRTAEWSTVKADALSGKRTRTQNFSYPIYHYELAFAALRSAAIYAEWQLLQGFVNQMLGGTGLFLFDDPEDDTATAQGFGTGDGASTSFQLVRTLGGVGEPVFFPNVIADIKVAGVTKTVNVDYTVGNYGVITFTTAPPGAAALTWDGTFYWGCRFDDDQFDFSNLWAGVWELQKLRFSTEKLP
jgi:uncharacterized protein (TIGR02217 family)